MAELQLVVTILAVSFLQKSHQIQLKQSATDSGGGHPSIAPMVVDAVCNVSCSSPGPGLRPIPTPETDYEEECSVECVLTPVVHNPETPESSRSSLRTGSSISVTLNEPTITIQKSTTESMSSLSTDSATSSTAQVQIPTTSKEKSTMKTESSTSESTITIQISTMESMSSLSTDSSTSSTAQTQIPATSKEVSTMKMAPSEGKTPSTTQKSTTLELMEYSNRGLIPETNTPSWDDDESA